MEKTGLVLGGGGAKGSYQMGAWKAFRELDLSFDLIVGTSIGALNGALMAAQDFDGADRLWNTIEDKQIFPDCDGRRLEEVRQLENPLDLLRFAARDVSRRAASAPKGWRDWCGNESMRKRFAPPLLISGLSPLSSPRCAPTRR